MPDLRRVICKIDPLLLLAVVLAAGDFALLYVVDPSRPGMFTPEGWFGFNDQGAYLRMAHEMAGFHLSPEAFRYGPGYPILAVPFLWLGLDYDPFVIVNAAAFVGVIAAAYVIGRRLGGRLLGAIAAFGLLFATPLAGFTTQPWNSTVSLVALVAVLLVATSGRTRPAHGMVLGLATGAAFAARYVDIVFIGAVATAAIISTRTRWRTRDIAIAIGTMVVIVVLVLIAHWVVLGSPLTTPYASHGSGAQPGISDQELGAYDIPGIPGRFFGMFISPFMLGNRFGGASMLSSAFWFLLSIPGAFLVCRRGMPFRGVLMTAGVASIAAVAFYCAFRGAGPGSVQFGALHYFKMWWPLWALLSAAAISWVATQPWEAQRGGPQPAPDTKGGP